MEKITRKAILILLIIFILGGLFYFSDFSVKNKINNLTTETNNISITGIKEKATKFINNFLVQPGTTVKVTDLKEESGIYKLTVKAEDKESLPIYITKDGKKIIPQVIDMEEVENIAKKEAEKSKVVSKSDKPNVELFVMSYCPYGTQFEKGYLPVVEKLKGQINSSIKFVNYVMHGEKEANENIRQYCIEKNEPEKTNSYLSCFLEEGDAKGCLVRNKVDEEKLAICEASAKKEFEVTKDLADKAGWLSGKFPKFKVDDALNKKYGVQGSPTLVINGQVVQPQGRDANSILKSICSAFNNPPKACSENISSESPAPGFGYGKTSGTQVEASCGV